MQVKEATRRVAWDEDDVMLFFWEIRGSRKNAIVKRVKRIWNSGGKAYRLVKKKRKSFFNVIPYARYCLLYSFLLIVLVM